MLEFAYAEEKPGCTDQFAEICGEDLCCCGFEYHGYCSMSGGDRSMSGCYDPNFANCCISEGTAWYCGYHETCSTKWYDCIPAPAPPSPSPAPAPWLNESGIVGFAVAGVFLLCLVAVLVQTVLLTARTPDPAGERTPIVRAGVNPDIP